jgi:hypothetical protein
VAFRAFYYEAFVFSSVVKFLLQNQKNTPQALLR